MIHPPLEKLYQWFDAALGAREAAAIEAHVGECPACAAEVELARDFGASLARVSAEPVAPELVERVAKRIPPPLHRATFGEKVFWFGMFCGPLVVGAIADVLSSDSDWAAVPASSLSSLVSGLVASPIGTYASLACLALVVLLGARAFAPMVGEG
jgi:anti-sigma factor RsiW